MLQDSKTKYYLKNQLWSLQLDSPPERETMQDFPWL